MSVTSSTTNPSRAYSLEMIGLNLSRPAHVVSEPLIRALATPIRPGKDGNYNWATLEIIRRIFTVAIYSVAALFAIPLALIGSGFEKAADLIRNRPFTYLKGNPKAEKPEGHTYKLMTLNACMLWGGLPVPLGGMRPPNKRVDALAKKIKKLDPDVLVMQEVAFDPAIKLHKKLKKNYPHFFTRIGPNPPLMESGLFIASKYKILNAGFIPFPDQVGIKRGAFWFETLDRAFITTHMEFGDTPEGRKKRKAQFDLIKEQIQELQIMGKTCFLLGDFNLDRNKELAAYNEMEIPKKFYDPYFTKYPNLDASSATCTDTVEAHTLGQPTPKKKWEVVDYALLAKGRGRYTLDVERVKMYQTKDPDQALSDHNGLLLTATRA